MIILNNREYKWYEGMTVRGLLDENDYIYKQIVVVVNGRPLHESKWAETEVHDGDNVDAIHLLAGG